MHIVQNVEQETFVLVKDQIVHPLSENDHANQASAIEHRLTVFVAEPNQDNGSLFAITNEDLMKAALDEEAT